MKQSRDSDRKHRGVGCVFSVKEKANDLISNVHSEVVHSSLCCTGRASQTSP